jgi:DNA-binding CsgD family transcriptional regulator
MLVYRQPSSQPLYLLASPLPVHSGSQAESARAVIFLADLEQTFTQEFGGFLSLFGLTQSEARVATALAVGIELKKFAAINSISDHTVCAHLKSVMGKMGVHRQIDVVRLVMAGALIRWPAQ